jgi:hypothetical protein
MSIPLDRLYHYIESLAKEVHGNALIYRFFPHGSKNTDDLSCIREMSTLEEMVYYPHLICYDQEPLNYNLYKNTPIRVKHEIFEFTKNIDMLPKRNLWVKVGSIYDHCLLLHSERRSPEVEIYQQNQFVPVYYWSHAIIARDWFRYARYVDFTKDIKKTFLIYNRAWSGTREYRLKFIDMLVENNLLDHCKTTFNPYDENQNYNDHVFVNPVWKPINQLENYLDPTTATSNSSADFEVIDYNSTDFEIVLETLFDDQRQQLTEKILRPIACKQPFILASTSGSLEYLRSYGFQTFGEIIDESYDTIQDPVKRMQSIVNTMKDIASWPAEYRLTQIKKINEITEFNHSHFFSDQFFTTVINELKINLAIAFDYVENNNMGFKYRDLKIKHIPEVKKARKNHETKNIRRRALNILKQHRKKNRKTVK